MAITINIYYTGEKGSAKAFAKEMVDSGIVNEIRAETGNLKYEYFASYDDPETVLLIDRWASQNTLDFHHKSKMMRKIRELRDKYDLKMRVERFVDDIDVPASDDKYVRK